MLARFVKFLTLFAQQKHVVRDVITVVSIKVLSQNCISMYHLFKDIGLHESYMCIIPFSSHSAMFYWKSVNLIGPLIVSFSLVDDDCVHWSWKLKIIFPYFRQALSQDCMRGHPATKMRKMFGGMPWRNAWKLKCLRCIFWIFSL